MIKLLGKVLGHSFGLVAIVMFTVLYATIGNIAETEDYTLLYVIDGVYVGGYALLPILEMINKSLESRVVRKEKRKIINSPEVRDRIESKLHRLIDENDWEKIVQDIIDCKVLEKEKPTPEPESIPTPEEKTLDELTTKEYNDLIEQELKLMAEEEEQNG